MKEKIQFFEMDYFGSHQMIAELTGGFTIHAFHQGKRDCDHIDVYRDNTIIYSRDIRSDSKYEWIHLCRGYVRIKFLQYIPELSRNITLIATIPHDAGKFCTIAGGSA